MSNILKPVTIPANLVERYVGAKLEAEDLYPKHAKARETVLDIQARDPKFGAADGAWKNEKEIARSRDAALKVADDTARQILEFVVTTATK
jgi:hypothetical protein